MQGAGRCLDVAVSGPGRSMARAPATPAMAVPVPRGVCSAGLGPHRLRRGRDFSPLARAQGPERGRARAAPGRPEPGRLPSPGPERCAEEPAADGWETTAKSPGPAPGVTREGLAQPLGRSSAPGSAPSCAWSLPASQAQPRCASPPLLTAASAPRLQWGHSSQLGRSRCILSPAQPRPLRVCPGLQSRPARVTSRTGARRLAPSSACWAPFPPGTAPASRSPPELGSTPAVVSPAPGSGPDKGAESGPGLWGTPKRPGHRRPLLKEPGQVPACFHVVSSHLGPCVLAAGHPPTHPACHVLSQTGLPERQVTNRDPSSTRREP